MKTAIKLVLIYFLMQIVASVVVLPIGLVGAAAGKELPASFLPNLTLLLSILGMTFYLYLKGYLKNDGRIYSLVSFSLCGQCLVAVASLIVLEDLLLSHLRFLPDLMEDTFNLMQSGWLGILLIALVGPVLEELLFRGAITKLLLQKYTPTKAILLSALIFGLFHINPVQVVGATLVGILLAWIYWRTGSLIPCILMHVFNNALSVFLTLRYPDADYLADLLSPTAYGLTVIAAAVLLCLVCQRIHTHLLHHGE